MAVLTQEGPSILAPAMGPLQLESWALWGRWEPWLGQQGAARLLLAGSASDGQPWLGTGRHLHSVGLAPGAGQGRVFVMRKQGA